MYLTERMRNMTGSNNGTKKAVKAYRSTAASDAHTIVFAHRRGDGIERSLRLRQTPGNMDCGMATLH